MAGKTRVDKQCICGMYRHSICPDCGAGHLQAKGAGVLVGHINKAVHVCGAASVQPLGGGQSIVPLPTAESAGNVPAMLNLPDGIAEAIAALTPPMDRFGRYITRRVNTMDDLSMMESALAAHHNVVLTGPKGCGKNHLTEALAAKHGLGLISVSSNIGMTVEDMVGQWVIENGTMHHVDGALTFAMRYGLIYVQDEVNAMPREVGFALHQTTDDRRQLVLVQKGREVVRAHPNFMFVGTMNPFYAGTKPLQEAFKDRFRIINLDYSVEVERKLIKDKRLLNVAKDVRKSHASTNEDRLTETVSTRMLIAHEENVARYDEAEARAMFINGWDDPQERVVVAQVYDAHMGKPTV